MAHDVHNIMHANLHMHIRYADISVCTIHNKHKPVQQITQGHKLLTAEHELLRELQSLEWAFIS